VRDGEYEGLAARLASGDHTPDFGPAQLNERSGATAVGARDFLVAYNVNLNTTSTRRANAIAFDVREKGRERLDPQTMKPVKDASGQTVWDPGSLTKVKGIGWFIEEYGVAQVSLNLTDISVTPMHVAFDECCKKAEARGVRVTGSELVGLVPMRAMLDAGRYFLKKQRRSTGVSDDELIKIAVKSLGLDDLYPFVKEDKIVELAITKKRGGGSEAAHRSDRAGLHRGDRQRVARPRRWLDRGDDWSLRRRAGPRWWRTSPPTSEGGTPAGRSSATTPSARRSPTWSC
jgi:glutamate formiminotransferase/formiminotetrahydrofolate cyclodeaminase